MLINYNQETARINNIIINNVKITEKEFLESEIQKFLSSKARKDMIIAEDYYKGNHDILKRKRTVIGQNGELEEVHNLPNNKLIDNQYGRLVDQKNNYLLGKPFSLNTEDDKTRNIYSEIFNKKFNKTLNLVGEDSLNSGISYIYTFINQKGEIDFKRFKSYEVLPFWEDGEHTELVLLIRIYNITSYEGIEKIITKVEIYKPEGMICHVLDNGKLIIDVERMGESDIIPYLSINNTSFSWGKIPIVVFKSNAKEIPLIKRVKSLQDALNTIRSDFMNNMQEDARNTIIVLKNYDGENLGEFRRNLAEYGAVKVRAIDGADGGIETLKVEVNATNYQVLIEMLKKAIIENARGFDCKDERMSSNPNQMNIQSMYADIDLDANAMELEFQSGLEELFYFINIYLKEFKNLDLFNHKVEIIFNKDQMINESEVITDCLNSLSILSKETVISQHPWVRDVSLELGRIKKEEVDTDYEQ